MVTELGGIKIMDFGIARVAGAEHLTNDGHMMGTPAYMAPEQVMAKEVDGRADLYSCGVVFYRLLTGTLPFQADTAIGMVQKQLSDQPTPAHAHRADLPEWCQTILDRALAKSPADRFQTAEEFRAALMSAIGSVATEQTGAYAAARLPGGTPLAMPVPAAAGKTPAPRPAPPRAAAPNQSTEGATIVLKRNHFAMAGGLLAVVAVGVAVLAYAALRRPAQVIAPAAAEQTAPASPSPAADPPPAAETAAASTPPSPAPATPAVAVTSPAAPHRRPRRRPRSARRGAEPARARRKRRVRRTPLRRHRRRNRTPRRRRRRRPRRPERRKRWRRSCSTRRPSSPRAAKNREHDATRCSRTAR